MSVERFPVSFGLTGAEADPCPCFPIPPFTLHPESSVPILNTSDCCWFSYFLSTSFFPIFSSAEVPNFLNFVLKTLVCPMILVQEMPWVSYPCSDLWPCPFLTLKQVSFPKSSDNSLQQLLCPESCSGQAASSVTLGPVYIFVTFSDCLFGFWCPGCFVANDKQFHERSAFVFTPHHINLGLEDWAPFTALSCWFTIWNVVSILCHY